MAQTMAQKLYVVDSETSGILHITHTHVLPHKGDVLTVLDKSTGVYTIYDVLSTSHGFHVDNGTLPPSKQGASDLVSTVYVEFVKHLTKEEQEP